MEKNNKKGILRKNRIDAGTKTRTRTKDEKYRREKRRRGGLGGRDNLQSRMRGKRKDGERVKENEVEDYRHVLAHRPSGLTLLPITSVGI